MNWSVSIAKMIAAMAQAGIPGQNRALGMCAAKATSTPISRKRSPLAPPSSPVNSSRVTTTAGTTVRVTRKAVKRMRPIAASNWEPSMKKMTTNSSVQMPGPIGIGHVTSRQTSPSSTLPENGKSFDANQSFDVMGRSPDSKAHTNM